MFCTVISLAITMMAPMIVPTYIAETGYTYEDVYQERASLEAFTGESMLNKTPWKLDAVYTAWNPGLDVNRESDTGWVYGESVAYTKAGYYGTTQIGDTNSIYLDPDQKSTTPLAQSTTKVTENVEVKEWWAYGVFGNLSLVGFAAELIGLDTTHIEQRESDVNSWTFSGYRYSFDPMLKIDWQNNPHNNPGSNYEVESQLDAKLSIVWYEDSYSQGLSSGLILWNDKTHGVIANLESSDIIDSYNAASSQYSSKYQLDYEGVRIWINIRFDQNVIANGMDLADAFDKGYWSLAITASSLDNFIDIKNSNSLSSSMASLLETYEDIFSFSMPGVPYLWSIVLWILCILPLEIAVLMFLSRFGILGIGAGILGNVLLATLLGGA